MSPMGCDFKRKLEWRKKCTERIKPWPYDSSQACVVCQVSLFVRRDAYEECLYSK